MGPNLKAKLRTKETGRRFMMIKHHANLKYGPIPSETALKRLSKWTQKKEAKIAPKCFRDFSKKNDNEKKGSQKLGQNRAKNGQKMSQKRGPKITAFFSAKIGLKSAP